jgi:hypothetical protein
MDSAGKHHRPFSIVASKPLLHAGEPELPGSIYKLLLKNVSRDDPLTNEEILVSTLQVELCRFDTQRSSSDEQELKDFRATLTAEQWKAWLQFAREEKHAMKKHKKRNSPPKLKSLVSDPVELLKTLSKLESGSHEKQQSTRGASAQGQRRHEVSWNDFSASHMITDNNHAEDVTPELDALQSAEQELPEQLRAATSSHQQDAERIPSAPVDAVKHKKHEKHEKHERRRTDAHSDEKPHRGSGMATTESAHRDLDEHYAGGSEHHLSQQHSRAAHHTPRDWLGSVPADATAMHQRASEPGDEPVQLHRHPTHGNPYDPPHATSEYEQMMRGATGAVPQERHQDTHSRGSSIFQAPSAYLVPSDESGGVSLEHSHPTHSHAHHPTPVASTRQQSREDSAGVSLQRNTVIGRGARPRAASAPRARAPSTAAPAPWGLPQGNRADPAPSAAAVPRGIHSPRHRSVPDNIFDAQSAGSAAKRIGASRSSWEMPTPSVRPASTEHGYMSRSAASPPLTRRSNPVEALDLATAADIARSTAYRLDSAYSAAQCLLSTMAADQVPHSADQHVSVPGTQQQDK